MNDNIFKYNLNTRDSRSQIDVELRNIFSPDAVCPEAGKGKKVNAREVLDYSLCMTLQFLACWSDWLAE